MCSGSLLGKLLLFSVPLMLSGILQLLFNAADIIVVGQFTGDAAMAAVGSTSSLNNLIINFFLGLSAGGSVVVAQYFGMKAFSDVEESVHTAILLGLVCGLAMVAVGVSLARPMLTLMGTTADVIDQAVLYMRIVFAGMPALMVYDFGAGILRAIGDTKRPLLFLFCGGDDVSPLLFGEEPLTGQGRTDWNTDWFHLSFMRPGFRKVVFSVIIMAIVLFYRKGLMGDREFSIEGARRFFQKHFKKKQAVEGGSSHE